MRRLLLSIGVLALAVPAAAEDVGVMQMRARSNAGLEPLGDPVETHDFAVCVARKYEGAAILEELPNTNDEIDFVFGNSRYGAINCGPQNRSIVVGARFMRGGAAEYLLASPGRWPGQKVFKMPSNEDLQKLSAETRSAVIFIQIGECAARANPDGVKALLATGVGTPEERSAFAAVTPSIGGCVPAGINFGIPRLLARAYLAEGAYRNAVAAQAGQN